MKYKILGIIKYYNDTSENLMKYLHISNGSFYNKLNGRNSFTQKEIRMIKDRYKLSAEQIDDIFFTDKVSY